ncbi:unnamed protein product [Acanthoscelides obtectus]|uniref:Uncharacterized protein n=1 Tax=Acanthoscelides obtectus TaxID=200917 RepID=A0A9P0JP53_ACAOB|nr:unnamed protein product [Acanthoscelides obtectus]CAK1642819.1 hypothetical protein AOBTE_LOCUS13224 [Acanthoscelides obtectus]
MFTYSSSGFFSSLLSSTFSSSFFSPSWLSPFTSTFFKFSSTLFTSLPGFRLFPHFQTHPNRHHHHFLNSLDSKRCHFP